MRLSSNYMMKETSRGIHIGLSGNDAEQQMKENIFPKRTALERRNQWLLILYLLKELLKKA